MIIPRNLSFFIYIKINVYLSINNIQFLLLFNIIKKMQFIVQNKVITKQNTLYLYQKNE
jgi:hypothetical protein